MTKLYIFIFLSVLASACHTPANGSTEALTQQSSQPYKSKHLTTADDREQILAAPKQSQISASPASNPGVHSSSQKQAHDKLKIQKTPKSEAPQQLHTLPSAPKDTSDAHASTAESKPNERSSVWPALSIPPVP